MKQTTNYQLPSWDSEDRILRTDFNTLTEKVDTALAENAAAVTALTEQVATKGNCTVEHQTYTGTGETSVSLTFSGKPLLVVVMTNNVLFVAVNGSNGLARNAGVGGEIIGIGWSGNTMSWTYNESSSLRCNVKGTTYYVTAVMAA